KVGLVDGRVVPLEGASASVQRALKLYDVVFVRVNEPKGNSPGRAELRVRPHVQGAAVVLENKTGRILAMAGGFSYPLSQFNSAPARSLDRICALAIEAQIYKECERYYPFILGAQPARLVDIAAFYAAIANEGLLPRPYAVDSIERGSATVYRRSPVLTSIGST